ncbi:MAG TPA: hypothetical protein VH302_15130 [Bryobacteraceae bacterium]|jgi:hypothetical protein|nr:hypothetical protein [Bryobacteraceae bacterium]
MFNSPVRKGLSYLSVGLLAASTLAFAQDAPQYPTNTNNDQQTTAAAGGGWKRVGDSATDPNAVQNYPAYTAGQNPTAPQGSGDMQQPPPPPTPSPGQNGYGQQAQQPMGPYQQSGQYPQQGQYPPQGQFPQQAGPYTQQAPYNGYPQYGQQPMNGPQGAYGQQQNYPAPPPVPASLTISQGTYITVRVNQLLSSDKNQPGDAFSATLVDPIVVNGIVVAEPGETVGGRVAVVEKHGVGHPAKLGVQITTLTLVDGQQVNVLTQLTSRKGGTTPGGAEAGTIIGTTGLGAAIGAAAGWGRGAAIGAGAGALASIVGVVVTHNHASVIAPEQVLTFQIQQPVTINTSSSQAAFRYVEPGEYSQQTYGGGPGPYAGGPYSAGGMPYAAAYPGYAYSYPYSAWGYPYYWGPSFAFYYGRGYYPYRGYYGRGFVGYRGGGAVRGGYRR